MPLKPGKSKKVISENIKELQDKGKYNHNQVIAIAFSQAKKIRKKKE